MKMNSLTGSIDIPDEPQFYKSREFANAERELLLTEAIDALKDLLGCSMATSCSDCNIQCRVDDDYDTPQSRAKAIINKFKGE